VNSQLSNPNINMDMTLDTNANSSLSGRTRSNSLSSASGGRSRSDSLSSQPDAAPLMTFRRTATITNNPVVAAMLSSNTLRDCHQVRDMYDQCMLADSSSTICSTAKNYYLRCSTSGK
jgi:hypothetical protein